MKQVNLVAQIRIALVLKKKKHVGPTFFDIYGIDCHVKVFLDVAFLGCLPGEMMMSVWNAVAVPVLAVVVGWNLLICR